MSDTIETRELQLNAKAPQVTGEMHFVNFTDKICTPAFKYMSGETLVLKGGMGQRP